MSPGEPACPLSQPVQISGATSLSVRQYHVQLKMRRRRTPLKNQTITIVTVLGATDNI